MPDKRSAFPKMRFVVLAAILGIFIGGWAAIYRYEQLIQGKLIKWQALGIPPGNEKISSGAVYPQSYENNENVDVLVVTESGTGYQYQAGAWQESGYDPQTLGWNVGCDEDDHLFLQNALSKLPSAPVSCTKYRWTWEWTIDNTYVVVLADNSVWVAHHYVWGLTTIEWPCLGAVIGSLAAVLVVLTAHQFRKRLAKRAA